MKIKHREIKARNPRAGQSIGREESEKLHKYTIDICIATINTAMDEFRAKAPGVCATPFLAKMVQCCALATLVELIEGMDKTKSEAVKILKEIVVESCERAIEDI